MYVCIRDHGKLTLFSQQGGRSTASSFNLFEEDPDAAKKENAGIKSMGNGMGGRKGAASSFNWDF